MIECLFGFSCGFSLLVRRLGSRWNLSFLGMSLRYFLLFCGRPPLLINSQVHSTNWLTLLLRENPKFSREEKQSVYRILNPKIPKRKRVWPREKIEKRIVLNLISVPNPIISSVEICTRFRSPLTRAPTRTPSGEIGPEDSWPRVLKDQVFTCRKIDLQCKFWNLSLYSIIVTLILFDKYA